MRPIRIHNAPLLALALAAACSQSSTTTVDAGLDASALPDLARAADLSMGPAPDLSELADLTAGGGDDAALPAGCKPVPTSNLAGVSLRFTGKTCSFTLAQAAAGISLPYSLEVAKDVSSVVAAPGGAACQDPGASGLIVFETILGGQESYCVCDTGRCIPPTLLPTTVRAGSYPGALSWDGKNWSGPSDFGAPKGPAFPAGVYDFIVSAVGQVTGGGGGPVPFEVKLVVPITLR